MLKISSEKSDFGCNSFQEINLTKKSHLKALGCKFDLAIKPHSHCADVATVYPDAGQPVYRDAPGHIS